MFVFVSSDLNTLVNRKRADAVRWASEIQRTLYKGAKISTPFFHLI